MHLHGHELCLRQHVQHLPQHERRGLLDVGQPRADCFALAECVPLSSSSSWSSGARLTEALPSALSGRNGLQHCRRCRPPCGQHRHDIASGHDDRCQHAPASDDRCAPAVVLRALNDGGVDDGPALAWLGKLERPGAGERGRAERQGGGSGGCCWCGCLGAPCPRLDPGLSLLLGSPASFTHGLHSPRLLAHILSRTAAAPIWFL